MTIPNHNNPNNNSMMIKMIDRNFNPNLSLHHHQTESINDHHHFPLYHTQMIPTTTKSCSSSLTLKTSSSSSVTKTTSTTKNNNRINRNMNQYDQSSTFSTSSSPSSSPSSSSSPTLTTNINSKTSVSATNDRTINIQQPPPPPTTTATTNQSMNELNDEDVEHEESKNILTKYSSYIQHHQSPYGYHVSTRYPFMPHHVTPNLFMDEFNGDNTVGSFKLPSSSPMSSNHNSHQHLHSSYGYGNECNRMGLNVQSSINTTTSSSATTMQQQSSHSLANALMSISPPMSANSPTNSTDDGQPSQPKQHLGLKCKTEECSDYVETIIEHNNVKNDDETNNGDDQPKELLNNKNDDDNDGDNNDGNNDNNSSDQNCGKELRKKRKISLTNDDKMLIEHKSIHERRSSLDDDDEHLNEKEQNKVQNQIFSFMDHQTSHSQANYVPSLFATTFSNHQNNETEYNVPNTTPTVSSSSSSHFYW